jgi:predicted nucleotidyltransferase
VLKLGARQSSRLLAQIDIPNLGINMPKMGIKHAATNKSSTPQRTSLSDALFTRTQQKVLGLLFGQPHRSFFATELIALAGGGSGAVQRELKRLAESGLVTVTRLGNQHHYQANAASPLFASLHDIALKTSGLAEPLRAALQPLATQINFAFIYGSVAAGADTASSDIDLLLVAEDLALETVHAALEPAEQQLARRIGITLYTLAEFRQRRDNNNAFLAKVLAGPLIPLIGDIRGLA